MDRGAERSGGGTGRGTRGPAMLAALLLAALPLSGCDKPSGDAASGGDIASEADSHRIQPDRSWERIKALGHTAAEEQRIDGRRFLRLRAEADATLYYRMVDIDLVHYPVLEFRWTVEAPLYGLDERRLDENDAAARLYVVMRDADGREGVLGYIWSGSTPAGTWQPSPFVSNTFVLVIRSGPPPEEGPVRERRDLLADARTLLKMTAPRATEIRILTDTDQTRGTATAWYGPILFRPR